jgi:hypothetical protein
MANGDEIADYIERVWIQPTLQPRIIPILSEEEYEETPDEPIYKAEDFKVFNEEPDISNEGK